MKGSTGITVFSLICLCLVQVGCKKEVELYYDASEYSVDIKGYGFEYPDELTYAESCVAFDSQKLRDYVGWKIVGMKIYNPDPNVAIPYTPLVYEARAGFQNPDSLLIVNENPTEIPSLNWKRIPLDRPIVIEESIDYWAGYRVTPRPDQYPLAVGSEPSYGNSYTSSDALGTFVPVTENWVIRIVVEN